MKTAPILIIDKIGFISNLLAFKLSNEFPIVLVGKTRAEDLEKGSGDIIRIPFSKKFPTIQDDKYSHIILIDDSGFGLDILPSVIEKVKNINADFIFVQKLSAKSKYWSSKVLKLYSSSSVVFYGDVFDNKLIHRREGFNSAVNEYIYQIQKHNRIEILGDGLESVYPVFINDLVNGLIDIVFDLHKSNSVFYIFPKHPITELSLAHMIQKANPEISIDFSTKNSIIEAMSIPSNGKYLLEDKYPLAHEIRKINIKETDKYEKEMQTKREIRRPNRLFLSAVWTVILLMIAPFVFTLFFSFLGLSALYYAKTKESAHLSSVFFYVGKKASSILAIQARIIGQENKLKNLFEDIDLGHKISGGLALAFNSTNYFSKVVTGISRDPIGDFSKGQNDLRRAIVFLERLRAENKIPKPFKGKLESVGSLIKFLSDTENILPDIFGIEGEKKYLVLFQDSMELRPGGGIIGSYGILKLNMGRIVDFSIHDVSDADKQLRGHLEPPFAIRRHLPSEHWYLKDSNFNVDFVKSASASSNFLFVETGQKVSGVIGIDDFFIKNILRAIGLAEKDFLMSPYKTIAAKISSSNLSYFAIAAAISEALAQKHLIIVFNNNLQDILSANGWSSALWDKRRESGESISDFLGINEANLGGNKANNFIYRQVSQETTIGDDGSVFSEITIKYKNAGVSTGGDYKNYLRLILPLNAAISEISINDISQSMVNAITDPLIYEEEKFKAPIGLEVEKNNEENKTIYGFMINIPIGKIAKIKVKYNLAGKISLDQNVFSYNLKLFKQPGIDSIPYSLSLAYPSIFNAVNVSDGMKEDRGKLLYSKKIAEDQDLSISFAKK